MNKRCLLTWLGILLAQGCESDATQGLTQDVEAVDMVEKADSSYDIDEVDAHLSDDLSQDDTPDANSEPAVWLVRNGKSEHTVVVQQGASASERLAAEELRAFIKTCTGVELPLHDLAVDPVLPTTPLVVIGLGQLARDMGLNPVELGDQGYAIKTNPPHVLIGGTAKAGTMYGVHRFLEDFLGVRWLAPGVTITPSRKDVGIPNIDMSFVPPFLWRHTSYDWPGADEAFLAHQADNDGAGGPDSPYGEQYRHDGRAHSYFWYVSPEEFFDTHPEYFSEIGGIRQREETQLCLTNPDVLDIVTERMLKRMAEKPDHVQHNFSQMDYYNYCECEKCRAMNEKYGTKGGTQFWFVNQLAERTSAIYPNKLIGTLAYMYTEEPPVGMVMHDNVAIWLCHMYPSCDSHPIRTCPKNAHYKERAEKWSKITKHLYVWHYIVNFAHYYNPFPNFRAIADDMRFYRDIGVEGIYLQGMGHKGGGGEFYLLRPYYAMKLYSTRTVTPMLS